MVSERFISILKLTGDRAQNRIHGDRKNSHKGKIQTSGDIVDTQGLHQEWRVSADKQNAFLTVRCTRRERREREGELPEAVGRR